MANIKLLCLLLLYLIVDYSDCGRFSGGRSGGSRSSSSRGGGSSSGSRHSYSSSSGHSGSSKPSSSGSHTNSWSSGSSSRSGSSYPASTGLSGSGSGSSWSSGSSYGSKYPSSTGLSGSGSGSKYPSSPGLSGSGSGYPWLAGSTGSGSGSKYPASTGLSGSGSSNKYPPSTGLSGTGSGYPSSTGLSGSGSSNTWLSGSSGFGTASKYPSSTGLSGSGSVSKYPASTGLSGTGSNSEYPKSNLFGTVTRKPTFSTGSNNYYNPSSKVNSNPSHPYHQSNAYNTNNVYNPGFNGNGHYGNGYGTYYYSAPQHVYITEYRNSNSRFGDLLTGLTLYNLGRSHSHYHDHYYDDDYYRHRYTGNSQRPYEKPKDDAYCTLRVKDNGKFEVLKIPCEIVSTFTEGSQKSTSNIGSQTVCVSNYTFINNTQPVIATTPKNSYTENDNRTNNVGSNETLSHLNVLSINDTKATLPAVTAISNYSSTSSVPETSTQYVASTSGIPISALINVTAIKNQSGIISDITTLKSNNSTKPTITTVISNITTTNSTTCTTTDPLSVKGPPVNASSMECEVNIITKDSRFSTKVDCQTLMRYSKMREPPKTESPIVPQKAKLKSWLSNPPWWMSLFIAV